MLDEDASPSATTRKSRVSASIVDTPASVAAVEKKPNSVSEKPNEEEIEKEKEENNKIQNFKLEEKSNNKNNDPPREGENFVYKNFNKNNNTNDEYREILEAELHKLAIATDKDTKEFNYSHSLKKEKDNRENSPNFESLSKPKKDVETYNSNLTIISNDRSIIESYTRNLQIFFSFFCKKINKLRKKKY